MRIMSVGWLTDRGYVQQGREDNNPAVTTPEHIASI